jgi:protein-S-isoprenylcysteine O-methyltransferase Ste14
MKKALIFIFGVISYFTFFFTFLYAIGFVGNIVVPKTIDAPTETAVFQAILINTLLLGLFAVQHTVMARPAFKAWWTKYISHAMERPIFVLLASLALILMFWQWQSISIIVWQVDNPVIAAAIQGIFFAGWGIVLLATFMINHFHLFGLKQVWDNLINRKPADLKFQVKYFYKFVRHPLMLGFMIGFWATPTMTLGHLIFAIVTTAYMVIDVKFFEEKDLRLTLGKDYKRYQEEVPMFVPFTKPGKPSSSDKLPAWE